MAENVTELPLKQERRASCVRNTVKETGLEKYNASNQDFFRLLEWLDWEWKAEHIIFKDNSVWPVLVIFKEQHSSKDVKKENLLSFIKNKQYFNFLATEWTNNEIFWEFQKLKFDIKKTINFILTWTTLLSSESIEEYYQDELLTCWVDFPAHVLQDTKLNYLWWTISAEQLSSLNSERDYTMVSNIKHILLAWNNNWKNFIPLVVWWDHAQSLSEQAKDFWFKGVIIFTPKSYK